MSEHKFIRTPEKRDFIKELNETFGISELPYLLIESGKEKIRAFSGTMSKDEILELATLTKIEGVGIYFMKKEESGLRLSFEACQLLRNQITKNILYINDNQLELWIRGHDLELKAAPGTYVIAHGEYFLGCGKSNGEKIFNYVPKERRIKKPLAQEGVK
jgi:NOL1/NOP2/fmu family ribosome biogenesis protein